MTVHICRDNDCACEEVLPMSRCSDCPLERKQIYVEQPPTIEMVEKTPDCVWKSRGLSGYKVSCKEYLALVPTTAIFCPYCGGKLKLEDGK